MMENMGGGMLEQKGGPADATPQMRMMHKRMGMMEMMMQAMMDQMLQHQQAMESMPAR
jgi:hypothetical protein